MSVPAAERCAGAAGRVARAAFLAGALAVVGVFHIWSRTRVLETGYALGELAKEHARLSSEHDRLRLEVETLRSPRALEKWAQKNRGMAPPAPGTVSVAHPRLASAAAGAAGVDGVGHRPAPAGPLSQSGRVAAGPAAAPGEKVAFRGPPGGVAPRERE